MKRFPNVLAALMLFVPAVLAVVLFAQSRSDLQDVLRTQQQQKLAAEQRTRAAVEQVVEIVKKDVRALLRAHDASTNADLRRLLHRIAILLNAPPEKLMVLERSIVRERVREREPTQPGRGRSRR